MVFLPSDAVIAEAKLTEYLLVPLLKDDKSKFLAQAGYTLDNWQRLESDLRVQILSQPAERVEMTRYGEKYAIRASLTGVNGVKLSVVAIWIVTESVTKFVTLVPEKGVNE